MPVVWPQQAKILAADTHIDANSPIGHTIDTQHTKPQYKGDHTHNKFFQYLKIKHKVILSTCCGSFSFSLCLAFGMLFGSLCSRAAQTGQTPYPCKPRKQMSQAFHLNRTQRGHETISLVSRKIFVGKRGRFVFVFAVRRRIGAGTSSFVGHVDQLILLC